jgi:hypothetical protein
MVGNTLKDIQSMLDENKEQIPEGFYLKMSNLMKQKYEEEQKTEKFYKVTEEEWCDCCAKSWVEESDPDDLCHCCCSKCHSLLRDCRYTCYENDA